MANKAIYSGLIMIFLLGLTVFFAYKQRFSYEWVNTYKVYEEFDLKKQLQKKSESVLLQRKKVLDSLELEIKYVYGYIKPGDEAMIRDFNLKKNYYLEKKRQFEEDNEQLEKQYNEQILTQLNQYLIDYSKERGIEMLIGADGKGTIIYADDKHDVTTDVIKYVNKKFQNLK